VMLSLGQVYSVVFVFFAGCVKVKLFVCGMVSMLIGVVLGVKCNFNTFCIELDLTKRVRQLS